LNDDKIHSENLLKELVDEKESQAGNY
jgi:hypothetical protein